MNLTRPYGPRDTATQLAGDPFFIGVDERRAPNQLEAGLCSYGKNLRFRNGKAETRKGVLICPWMKGNGRTPWTQVYGGCVFSDPNGNGDWFIIAADGGVWRTRPNMAAQPMSLPVGVTLTADTFGQFVPCTDGGDGVLVLLRGDDADPLVCVNLDTGFSAVPAATLGGMRSMPRSRFGLNHLNRLLLIEGRDEAAASDIRAYSEFTEMQDAYRINAGNSQALVRLQPMSNRTLLCFKTQSVLAVLDVQNAADGGLNGSGPEVVTESYGLAGAAACVRKGSNCYWLTNEPSLTSLRLTEQNETQDTDVRLSDALSQTFGRINSLYLAGTLVETWDGKLYVALPLDDARIEGPPLQATVDPDNSARFVMMVIPGLRYRWTQGTAVTCTFGEEQLTESGEFVADNTTVMIAYASAPETFDSQVVLVTAGNNAVAVYDLVNTAWCGVDEAVGVFAPKAFLKTNFLGRQRLFLLGADGTIRLYEEGFEDEVFDAEGNIVVQPIESVFVSRGYGLTDGDRQRTLSAACRLRTWDPSYTLGTLTQGYNTDYTEQESVTRDRTKYDQHDHADWNPANDDETHGDPGREDYSVTANDPDGLNVDDAGVDCDAHQTSTDRVALNNTGDWQQIKLTNNRGRLELCQVALEQLEAERRSGKDII